MRTYKHVIFDLDGTLTESRSKASEAMVAAIQRLCAAAETVAVISGAEAGQMHYQFPFADLWKQGVPIFLMAQSGNVCWYGNQATPDGVEKWRHVLPDDARAEVVAHIAKLYHTYTPERRYENLFDDRGAQISFSFVGHNADRAEKRAFDSTGAVRRAALTEYPFVSTRCVAKIAGTTCIDYTPTDGTKAHNVRRLIPSASRRDMVYIGDQLYPGGNDEDMLGVCDCIAVRSPADTYQNVTELLRV